MHRYQVQFRESLPDGSLALLAQLHVKDLHCQNAVLSITHSGSSMYGKNLETWKGITHKVEITETGVFLCYTCMLLCRVHF